MRILSWNISAKGDGFIQLRTEDIVDIILDFKPDVVCLQECTASFVQFIHEYDNSSFINYFSNVIVDPKFDEEWGVDSFCIIMTNLITFCPMFINKIIYPSIFHSIEKALSIPLTNLRSSHAHFSRFNGSNDDCGLLWFIGQMANGFRIIIGTTSLEPPRTKDQTEDVFRLSQLEACLEFLWAIAENESISEAILLGDFKISHSQERSFVELIQQQKWDDVGFKRNISDQLTVDWDHNLTLSVRPISKSTSSRPDRVLMRSISSTISNSARTLSLFGTSAAPKYAQSVLNGIKSPLVNDIKQGVYCPSTHYGLNLTLNTTSLFTSSLLINTELVDGVPTPCKSPLLNEVRHTPEHFISESSSTSLSIVPTVQTPDTASDGGNRLANLSGGINIAFSPPTFTGRKRRSAITQGEEVGNQSGLTSDKQIPMRRKSSSEDEDRSLLPPVSLNSPSSNPSSFYHPEPFVQRRRVSCEADVISIVTENDLKARKAISLWPNHSSTDKLTSMTWRDNEVEDFDDDDNDGEDDDDGSDIQASNNFVDNERANQSGNMMNHNAFPSMSPPPLPRSFTSSSSSPTLGNGEPVIMHTSSAAEAAASATMATSSLSFASPTQYLLPSRGRPETIADSKQEHMSIASSSESCVQSLGF